MRTYLYLSYKCNCNCFFCASDETNVVGNNNEFSLVEAKKFLLSSPNRTNLTISGGEPTIHKDFLEIVQFAKQHFEHISLMTNGIKFCDLNFLKSTLEAGVDSISIPFYSSNKDEHNWMVGNPQAFDKVMQCLYNVNDFLSKRKFNIQIKLLLAKFTYKIIPNSIDFIAENFPNIQYVSLYGFHIGEKALQKKQLCVINYNEARLYNDLAIRKLLGHDLRFNVCQIPFCAFSKDIIEVLISQNRILLPEDSYLKRPDGIIHIESSPEFVPQGCHLCSLNEFCPKIYGKNAKSFDYGVKPIIIV